MKKLIKQIQSDDIETVYKQVTDVATIWAAAGFIDQANKLLEKLWSLKLEHSGHTRLMDEGFQFIWAITEKKPGHIPFPEKDLSEMQIENWKRNFLPYWNMVPSHTNRIEGKDSKELSGNDLMLFGIGLAYDESSVDKIAGKEELNKSLNAIDKYMKELDVPYHDLKCLTCLCLLAAHLGSQNDTEKYLLKWGDLVKVPSNTLFITYLMRDSFTAKSLLTGILAPVFELTKEKCESDLLQISDSLDNRIAKGQTLVYENLTWEELLKCISLKAIESPDFEYEENALSNGWLGFPTATQNEIEKTESRLNIKLPKEYKDFLSASNGFSPFYFTPTLHPVDTIDWLKNLDPQLVKIWNETMYKLDEDLAKSFNSSILIGGHQEEQQLLLIPSINSENWECWFFSSWNPGETKYTNFRYYMEEELQRLEAEQ